MNSASPTAAGAGLRRIDDVIVSLLCMLLPAGFRARQRGEWAGDLMVLAQGNPRARWRYLRGAARTLPSLRNAISRQDAPPFDLPAGVRATAARILLFGLPWPILSWLLWVPARYLAFDVPGQIAASGLQIDPHSVWPLDHTPQWMLPLWAVLHLGAWAAFLGGPYLVAAVGATGTVTAVLRRRHHRVHRWTVLTAALTAFLVTLGWAATMTGMNTRDDGDLAGLLGAAAIVLGATTRNLRTRDRVALLFLGAGAVAVFLSFHTDLGNAMIMWFQD